MFFFAITFRRSWLGGRKKRKEKTGCDFSCRLDGHGHSVSGKRMDRVQGGLVDVQRKKSRTYLLFIIQPPKKAFWQQLEPIFRRPLRGLFFNQCHQLPPHDESIVVYSSASPDLPHSRWLRHWERERIAEICLFKCLLEPLRRKKKKESVDLCISTSRRNISLYITLRANLDILPSGSSFSC